MTTTTQRRRQATQRGDSWQRVLIPGGAFDGCGAVLVSLTAAVAGRVGGAIPVRVFVADARKAAIWGVYGALAACWRIGGAWAVPACAGA